MLFGTTREFMSHFGLKSLADLPRPKELEELLAEGERKAIEANARKGGVEATDEESASQEPDGELDFDGAGESEQDEAGDSAPDEMPDDDTPDDITDDDVTPDDDTSDAEHDSSDEVTLDGETPDDELEPTSLTQDTDVEDRDGQETKDGV